jgi:hypothetical protein
MYCVLLNMGLVQQPSGIVLIAQIGHSLSTERAAAALDQIVRALDVNRPLKLPELFHQD